MNVQHCGAILSECMCRSCSRTQWSSCMHMSVIIMWLSIAQPQATKFTHMYNAGTVSQS